MLKIERKPGDRVGRLTMIEEVERPEYLKPRKTEPRYFKFKCDCGNTVVTTWKPGSCGCLQKEAAAAEAAPMAPAAAPAK